MKGRRTSKVHKMKKIHADVAAVVEHLKKTLGSTWAQACVPRQQRSSLLVNPPRTSKPWESRDRMVQANGGRTYQEWIRGHLDSKVTWM